MNHGAIRMLAIAVGMLICGFSGERAMETQHIDIEHLTITILYDNYACDTTLQTDHGFACLIEGVGPPILFDTGGNGVLFMENLKRLKKDPDPVETIFISHRHYDHTGGMFRFLEANAAVTIYVPASAASSYGSISGQFGSRVVPVDGPERVHDRAMSTGEMTSAIISEQSLLIPTNRGTVVVTGCAHPGIANTVRRAGELTDQGVVLAVGGFHLVSEAEDRIQQVISRLQDMGVRYIAPSHCTGQDAIRLFEDAFGKGFIRSGVGRRIRGAELTE